MSKHFARSAQHRYSTLLTATVECLEGGALQIIMGRTTRDLGDMEYSPKEMGVWGPSAGKCLKYVVSFEAILRLKDNF